MTDSEKLDQILLKVQGIETKVQGLETKVQGIESDVKVIRQKVAHTELIMENEIRVNIQRVAEGHLDLSRNLHDAMRPGNEVEMLSIKVRMLESEVRDLKAKIS